MATPVAKLEFCQQPLSTSNAAATWIDVTRYCKSMTWSSGVSREFDDPQAGGATFVLKSMQRRFEPDYQAGAYYPNIVPGRRFRITVDGVTQGIYYAQSWDVAYPDRGNTYSEVVVTCTDGFWRLALDVLPKLSPPDATTYSEVIQHDNPVAHFPLNENGGNHFNGDPGPGGALRNGPVALNQPNPVLGDSGGAATFPVGTYGRAKVEDMDIFVNSGQFTIEAVATITSFNTVLASFGYKASLSAFNIELDANAIIFNNGLTSISASSPPSSGSHHYAATFDGSLISIYIDGVLNNSGLAPTSILASDADEFFYIHGGQAFLNSPIATISHVAYYTTALTAAQIQDHATAALSRGYAAATSGTRIATLATDSLWSTAGIPAGTITAAARFQVGQSTADEIALTAKTEQPGSLFYFDDAGNPDYRALMDTQTIAATFGDAAGEIGYDAIQLVYNDEVYNSSTVSGEGLDGATRSNTSSQSDYGVRAQDATGLIITSNSDAALVAGAIVDQFSTPRFRVDSITLNGANPLSRTQILNREIGDTIRVRRRGDGGTPIDIVTRILGKEKALTVDGDLRCTWTLARGFNAATATWRLGVTSFDELNTATVLG